MTEYRSRWKSLYEAWVELRLASNPRPLSEGGGGPTFALSYLLSELDRSDSPDVALGAWKRHARPQLIGWLEEASTRWGDSLRELHAVRKELRPENQIHDDVYHLALRICMCPWDIWHGVLGTLTDDGLAPMLAPECALNVELSQLLELRDSLPERSTELWVEDTRPQGRVAECLSPWLASGAFRVFRGQRRDLQVWPIRASLDRPDTDRGVMARRLAAAAEQLAAEHHIDFIRACAILQHYSRISGIGTHLLDITVEPLVALYFATCGSLDPGDTGMLCQWSLAEFENLGFGQEAILGNVSIVTPGDEPRLMRQRGLFICAPLPQAISQTVPFTVHFRQHAGLQFEDPARGITEAQLEDPSSAWLTRVRSACAVSRVPDERNVATVEATDVLTSDRLEDYLRRHIRAEYLERCTTLGRLCRFHLALTLSDKVPSVHSLRLLIDVAAQVARDPDSASESELIPLRYSEHARFDSNPEFVWRIWRETR